MSNNNKALPATVAAPLAINSMDDLQRMARLLMTSGVFGTTGGKQEQDLALAATKILAGHEMGIPPFAAMRHIHLVKGKTQIGYQLVGKMIKDSGRYNYLVKKLDETGCWLEFTEHGAVIGSYSFTKQDAANAGLLNNDNYKKFARQMFFARALTGGANIFCPDVFGGGGVEAEVEDVTGTGVTVTEPAPTASDAPGLPPPIEAEPVTDVGSGPDAQEGRANLSGSTPDAPQEGGAPW